MSCSKTSKPVQRRLRARDTAVQFEPVMDWAPAIGVDGAKMVIKRKSVQLAGTAPTWVMKPAIQVATTRPDDPTDWAVIEVGPYSGAGESNTGNMNIASTTAGKGYFRLGVAYYLGGTAPTDGQADVEALYSYVQCGQMVAAITQELQAYNTTTDSWVAISGWIPAADVDKVVALFIITNLANNFRCLLGYRTADTSIQSPSSWASLEGSTYRTSNGETSTGEISVSTSTVMFVQFGLAFSQSTAGSAPGQATVSTSVAVRRS